MISKVFEYFCKSRTDYYNESLCIETIDLNINYVLHHKITKRAQRNSYLV